MSAQPPRRVVPFLGRGTTHSRGHLVVSITAASLTEVVTPIKLSGRLLADDHAAAALLHARVSPAVWVAFWPLATLLLVSGAIRAVGMTAPPDRTLLFVAAFVALLPVCRRLGVQQRARRLYAETRDHQDVEIWFEDNAISMRSARGHVTLAWSAFYKWRINEQCVLLYLNSSAYLILPRRLTSESAHAWLEEKLRGSVGKAA
jgi:YcxB-like protein